ncbi:unnamed protein product, partial [Brassica rapa]
MFYVSSSLFLILCFFFCTLCFVVLVCSSSSAQFFVSSLVSSNPTISHKRYELKICSSSTVSWDSLLLPLRFGMALLGCIHKQLTTLHGEQTNEKGEKMYIQTRMASMREELWELLEKKDNTFVYMCGLKGMEKGIDEI